MWLLVALLLDLGSPSHKEVHVDRIVDNTVFTFSEGKKRFWLRQFVTYEKSWGGWRCTGYLVINEDTCWERTLRSDGRWQLSFFSVSGELRNVTTYKWSSAETTKDIEILDRELGPRRVLFGNGLGNLRDE